VIEEMVVVDLDVDLLSHTVRQWCLVEEEGRAYGEYDATFRQVVQSFLSAIDC
jgi:hypothetical protein